MTDLRYLLLPHDDPEAAYAAIVEESKGSTTASLRLAWDASEHPRGGHADNPGEFSTKPGRNGGGGKLRRDRRSDQPQQQQPGSDTSRFGRDVVHAIAKDQGFTCKDHIGDGPTTGFMCSVSRGTEEAFPIADLTPEHIAAYRDKHADLLADPDTYLGGWVWEGKVYLDVSKHFDDKDQALAAAKANDQIGIYDIGSGQTVETASAYGDARVAHFTTAASDLDVVNGLRALAGLPPLVHDTTSALARVALARVAERRRLLPTNPVVHWGDPPSTSDYEGEGGDPRGRRRPGPLPWGGPRVALPR